MVLAWLVFDRSAAWLGSTRGERGALVAGSVLFSLSLLDPSLRPGLTAAFHRPPPRSIVLALLISAGLLAYFPLFAWRTGASLALRPGWPLLLPGIFAQAGIAEEALYRVALRDDGGLECVLLRERRGALWVPDRSDVARRRARGARRIGP